MNAGHLLRCLIRWLIPSGQAPGRQSPKHAAISGLSLAQLADEYENHLCNRDFVFEKAGSKKPVVLSFEEHNFAHLVSLSSFAKKNSLDPKPYSGYEGWKNVRKGAITFEDLKRLDPDEYDYYRREWELFPLLCSDFFKKADSVRFRPEKVPGSTSLDADYILYVIHGQDVLHLGISKGDDGKYFPRSYFVRHTGKDKAYPTKYIAGMPESGLVYKGVK